MSCGFMFPPDPNNSLDLDLSNRQTMLSLDILEAQVQGWFFSYVLLFFTILGCCTNNLDISSHWHCVALENTQQFKKLYVMYRTHNVNVHRPVNITQYLHMEEVFMA